MNWFLVFYLITISILLLHEIESAYEKEWEILHLPGRIQGFILLHVPILVIFFYGTYEIQNNSHVGRIIGIAVGICGLLPFIIHKLIVKRKDRFNTIISNILVYSNIVSGILTVIFGL